MIKELDLFSGSPLNEQKLTKIIKDMLGDEFMDIFILDLWEAQHISVFVRTTTEFIWGERFFDDLAYDYLDELGYSRTRITAGVKFTGGKIYG